MVEQVSGERTMQPGALWRVLGLCILSVGVWGQDEQENAEVSSPANYPTYEVSISGSKVVLTCPKDYWDQDLEDMKITWEKKDEKQQDETSYTYAINNFSEMEDSGYYRCYNEKNKGKGKDHYLYVRARVCETCLELGVAEVATIIVADLCITLGLLVGVYHWGRNRKAKAKPVTRAAGTGGRPRGQTKERPPPVPSPDYEPLRKGQKELYSGLNHRGV
ncbi:T-cell surface glycoprotein CD3 epsilon chain [Sorex fumeus]|uniref:T-cell surface glycoprotein CD3 epsilon chain n=1 Tax=Sorex fumeus TaxID=62283 RepID=UPI0024AC9F20|nr:T-cell surface glycoprotein CD3 epsilon chain [Sorex fumeus]